MPTFYSACDEVIRLLKEVNKWQKMHAEELKLPSEPFHWPYWCEGGKLSQQIQDIILLIDAYSELLKKVRPLRVLFISTLGVSIEENVLKVCCCEFGIKLVPVSRGGLSALKRKAWDCIEPFLRQGYYVYKVVRCWFTFRGEQPGKGGGNDIVLQLGGAEEKHVNNILPFAKVLQQTELQPVIAAWDASSAHVVFREYGIRFDVLESLLSPKDILTSVASAFRYYIRLVLNKNDFYHIDNLKHKGIPCAALIWPSLVYFSKAELATRLRYHQAATAYAEMNSPIILKLFGETLNIYGYILWRSFMKTSRPLVLEYLIGILLDCGYTDFTPKADVYFLMEQRAKDLLQSKKQVPNDVLFLTGHSRFDDIKNDFSKEFLLSKYNIPGDYSLYLFLDTNCILRGYFSITEQQILVEAVLNIARDRNDICVIIKPHIGYKERTVENLLEKYGSPKNVYLFDKKESPYDFISVCDLIVTKYSTLAVEAMLLDRISVCAIFDDEVRWAIYGEAVEYVYSPQELSSLICRLLDDKSYLKIWTQKRMNLQNKYIKENLKVSNVPSAELKKEYIFSFLRKKGLISYSPSIE